MVQVHYHQDAVSSLPEKNACLMPRQPVVTTVVYQKPDEESGKEVVLWKPMLNFSAKTRDGSVLSDLYAAARAVPTTNGIMISNKRVSRTRHVTESFIRPTIRVNGKDIVWQLRPVCPGLTLLRLSTSLLAKVAIVKSLAPMAICLVSGQ